MNSEKQTHWIFQNHCIHGKSQVKQKSETDHKTEKKLNFSLEAGNH